MEKIMLDMNTSESESDQYWHHSNVSKLSSNFFNEPCDTTFLNLGERIFCEEANTIESFTEKPQNYKPVQTSLPQPNDPLRHLTDVMGGHGMDKNKMTLKPQAANLRVVLGESYSLEMYKSKEEKLSLLDEAISSCDGNAILVAILFIKQTMKPSLFNLEMLKRPLAVEHYLCYLHSEAYSSILPEAMSLFQRKEQAAMLRFRLANSFLDSAKISNLRKCLTSCFQPDSNLQFESAIVQSYIDLLELQIPVQEHDKEAIKGGSSILKDIPPSVSLVGTSALSTLYYACLYHFGEPENFLGSPLMVKKSQKLSEKQFIWKAVSALCRLSAWGNIEALFLTKSWVGISKMKSPIPFERIVSLLHHLSAPKEVKAKYCLFVEDVGSRIEIATKCGCHDVVLQAYKDLKDREMIEKYRINLKPKTPEDYLASQILNDKTIKWRN